MPILQFENASKDYVTGGERVPALCDVSLQVAAGKFVALVGRSGCGKSTLLHLAGAMDFPTAGSVRIAGRETRSLSDTALTRLRRSKIGFVFQSFQLLHTLSVVENVELPLMLAGEPHPRQRALERLAQTGTAELAGRMPYQLSGGQMQRVAIARALVSDPLLLLADEPTGNLDSSTGDAILTLLRGVAGGRGTAVVMATHSAEAAALADRVVQLRDGRIAGIREPVQR